MMFTLHQSWISASWREAQRLRLDAVDLDHLYLGLLGVGGVAARLLGEHGITLSSARERVRQSITDDLASLGITEQSLPNPLPFEATGTGTYRETARAKKLLSDGAKAPDTYALLVLLLQEPSGTVRRLVHADGVVPQDLAAQLRDGSTDPFTPTSVPPMAGLLPNPAYARRLTFYVSASPEKVAAALQSPAALPYFASFGDADVSEDGLTAVMARGNKSMTTSANVTTGDNAITWTLTLKDTPYAGQGLSYHRFTLTGTAGGTELTYEFGYRTFGLLGRLIEPITRRLAGGIGMLHQRYALCAYISEAD